jgi:phosphatidylglycerophosphatase A
MGRHLPAPGTWGSLAGLLYFAVFFSHASIGANLVASALGAVVAAWICGEAEVKIGRKDPGEVILDEFVAIPLCFLGWRAWLTAWPAWAALLAGFALFRFFDILKPLGISRLQRLRGGWGVVIDDTAAALAACATLHVVAWFWTRR